MRKLFFLLMGAGIVFLFIQCEPDKVTITPTPPNNNTNGTTTDSTATDTTGGNGNGNPVTQGATIHVSGVIDSDVTWASGNTYILDSLIVVNSGVTLTIESCVVVKAAYGASGLVIDKGAYLDAQGTATCPIIFTAESDSISPGDILSPNLTGNDIGLWAGIFLLGDAPVSTAISPAIVEHLPGGYAYGGTNTSDASGILRYLSIRHTGYELTDDYPASGLFLAGVGNGTMIDHVELFATADDGLIVLGGTVPVNDLVASSFQDDGIDCDKGYSGVMDNLIAIGGTSGNASLELDGGEGASNPSFTVRNSSFKGAGNSEDYLSFRQNVHCLIEDCYFFGYDEDSEVKLQRDQDADNWLASDIDVINLEFNTSHLTAGNSTIGAIFVDNGLNGNNAFLLRTPDASIVTTPTVGADASEFAGWTVADQSGALTGF